MNVKRISVGEYFHSPVNPIIHIDDEEVTVDGDTEQEGPECFMVLWAALKEIPLERQPYIEGGCLYDLGGELYARCSHRKEPCLWRHLQVMTKRGIFWYYQYIRLRKEGYFRTEYWEGLQVRPGNLGVQDCAGCRRESCSDCYN